MKIAIVGAVLSQASALVGPPLVVGLAEVQTDGLARRVAAEVTGADLKTVDSLARDQFGGALEGINLSLLVDTNYVEDVVVLRSHVIDRAFDTRDILEVRMALKDNGGELTVLVNHWPSRLSSDGGPKRISAGYYLQALVSDVLRYSLDDLWNAQRRRLEVPRKDLLMNRARTPLVVMGDFNDEPFNRSVETVRTTRDADSAADDLNVKGRKVAERFKSYRSSVPLLHNPFWSLVGGEQGTYYRSPRWRTYDQIMFSRSFVEAAAPGAKLIEGSSRPFAIREVLLDNGTPVELVNRNGKPRSFRLDPLQGSSDHFPVISQVQM